MTAGFSLAKFEQLSRDIFDEQQVFDSLTAEGYEPEWIWRGGGKSYGIRVEIDGAKIRGWVEQIGDMQGWNIQLDQ